MHRNNKHVSMIMSPEDGVSLIPRTLVLTKKTTLSQCRMPCLNMHHCRNLKSYVEKTGNDNVALKLKDLV